MSLEGPSFYDDATIFQNYMKRRERTDTPNDTLELPVVEELLGNVVGQDILDLGCGDGRFGLNLLKAGASSYRGIDGSENMVRVAQANLAGTAGTVSKGALEELRLPPEAFSRVCARLVLHYLQDLTHTFRAVSESLRSDGLFVFSVEHPVITSSDIAAQESGLRQNWTVDGYFNTGPRVTNWMGGKVVKHHRTVEDYFVAAQIAGLVVEGLREARPRREHFTDEELYNRRKRIPLFLVVAARKPPRADA
ncbi:class I SAM-dependent methyltransferase [Acidithiobacillus thiooxidans]|uniref:class I SAM-dependent DNA methyltransferase n=1 Tax=Acidithiobacillus thiooxidans TaxID=930 RepID=UPI0028546B14|nr:class I SAM-dependent methyltransferase [Acidithiobacillus thiooxidans]MDR7928300.1 class I SAM-dependent methyltransferase [Acidithiobacillus thiooxidans]